MDRSCSVPVTIITGFLGSGKSSLLNYILNEKHGEKIAVLLNEFGESGQIEKISVLNGPASLKEDADWIELENGCLCCTSKGETIAALERLIQRKGSYDKIVIETSGVADPRPLINMFWSDSLLPESIVFDGLITLVDCHNFLTNAADFSNEFCQQISLANVILLNKIDLIRGNQKSTLLEIVNFVKNVNPSAIIYEASYGR